MDGLFHGKTYEQMDDLEGKNPYFWFNTQLATTTLSKMNSRKSFVHIHNDGILMSNVL